MRIEALSLMACSDDQLAPAFRADRMIGIMHGIDLDAADRVDPHRVALTLVGCACRGR
jgi:hypothetical protein